MNQAELKKRFDAFADTKKAAIHDAVMQLLHAIGTNPMYVVDDDDITYITSIVENHVLDEIGAKTCVPYYGDDGVACYERGECQYTYFVHYVFSWGKYTPWRKSVCSTLQMFEILRI